jgi:hypothetical protein
MTFSISDDDDEWAMFSQTHPTAKPIFFRSRAGLPHVRDFAEKNSFARLRCATDPDQLTDAEVPKSTEALDAFEDSLLKALADERPFQVALASDAPVSLFDALTRSKGELEKASYAGEAWRRRAARKAVRTIDA